MIEEAREQRLHRPAGSAIAEGYEDDLVTGGRLAVPRAMLADEHAVAKGSRQTCTQRRGQAQRGRVWAKSVIRCNCLGDQIGSLRYHAYINMLAVVTIGPAIKTTVLH